MSSEHIKYTRNEIIDDDKEEQLLSSILELTFESMSNWLILKDEANLSMQTKQHPTTKRPIYRIVAANESAITMQQIYDYYQAGYKRCYYQSGCKHCDDIMYNIDENHDILYWKWESIGIVSVRDMQFMSTRFKKNGYKALNGNKYNIVGCIEYDVTKRNPLYMDPPKNYIRGTRECKAWIYYQKLDGNVSDDKFIFTLIKYTGYVGGWIPDWIVDRGNLNSLDNDIAIFHGFGQDIPNKLELRKENKIEKVESILMSNDDCKQDVHSNIIDTKGNESYSSIYKKCDDYNDKQEISAKESVRKQFLYFLKRLNMEKYWNKFEENECCDMESIQYFDDKFLENNIGINNKILSMRFLDRCEEIKQDINKFKNEYEINSILYERLRKYGIITLNILCDEIKNKNDLKYKYKITNNNQCDFLWNLIQNNENEMQTEGH